MDASADRAQGRAGAQPASYASDAGPATGPAEDPRAAGTVVDGDDLPSADEVRTAAARAGLVLDDADVAGLRASYRRIRAMAVEVRQLFDPSVEPSGPAVAPSRPAGEPWSHQGRDPGRHQGRDPRTDQALAGRPPAATISAGQANDAPMARASRSIEAAPPAAGFEAITAAAAAIRSGSTSPTELTLAALDRIERLNDRVHAFVTITRDLALDQAETAERELAAGIDRGPLHGIPVGVKDLYATRGIRTTAHSRVLASWIPGHDATAVGRLRDAGAVLLGKHGMAEFAFGGPAADGLFPAPRNPWNLDHEPGGSSSGSGAALAAGLCYGALGSDSGGSIRKPAAHCGIVGLKPSYGRVSRHGVVPLAWSLDHAGPMARTVEDCAILLGAIAGHDPRDPASSTEPVPDYRVGLEDGVRGLRLGYAPDWLHELGTIDADVLAAFEAALGELETQGAQIETIDAGPLMAGRSANTLLITAEAFAYHEPTLREHPELYGRSVRKRFREGAFIAAADYLDAQRARTVLRRQVGEILGRVDAILSPTNARPPEALATFNPDARFAEPSFVNPYNVLGLPAISVPCGFTRAGLPIGLQIGAGPFQEALVLRIARAYERVTPWHDRHPDLG